MAAPTVVKNGFFSVGNKKQANLKVTLGAASGVFDTGLAYVDHIVVAAGSAATAGISVKLNLSSSSTAVNGRVSINSGATGDDIFVTCYGR
jgi:hypothetical protein